MYANIADRIDKLAYSSPGFAQAAFKHLFGAYPCPRKYGDVFKRQYSLLRDSQGWSVEHLEEYQHSRLRELVRHAYRNVPYYRRMFDDYNLTPEDINSPKDLRRLPYLTKADVMTNIDGMTAKNIPAQRLSVIRTSGTTGPPLEFLADAVAFNAAEYAFIISLWNRTGYRFGDKIVVLYATLGIPPGQNFVYDPNDNALRLSPLWMTDDGLQTYVKLIRDFQPKYIQAIPSNIYLLARFMKENRIPPFPTVKALLLGSEALHEFQQTLLEEVFGCTTFCWYGHNERTVLAGQCEHSDYFHVFPEYGIMELVGQDDEPVTKEGEQGELVGSGFLNWASPFIRYKTGDIATYSSKRCRCGRHYPLLERVVGRESEYIVACDGSMIPFAAVGNAYGMDVGWSNQRIDQIQFLQEQPGEIVMLVVKNRGYSDLEVAICLSNWVQSRFGKSFKARVNQVTEITRDNSGKFRYLVQKLPIRVSEQA